MRYSTAPGSIVDHWLTVVDFPSRAAVAETFERLEGFQAQALAQLRERFPTQTVAEDLSVYAEPISEQEAQAKLSRVGKFFGFEVPTFVLDSQRLLQLWEGSSKDWPALLTSGTQASEEALWPLRVQLLTSQESAACERVFARAARVSTLLHDQKDGQLVERYLLVANGLPFQQEAADGLFAKMARTFLNDKERRLASRIPGEFYRKGSKLVPRRRRRRSDAGTKGLRKGYSMAKRHARLRGQSALRGLRRRPSDPEEQPIARMEAAPPQPAVPPIEAPLSPPRSKKRRLKISMSDFSSL